MLFSLSGKQIKRAAVLVAGQEGPYKDESPAYITLPTRMEYFSGIRDAKILSDFGHLLGTIPSTEAFKL